MTTKKTSNDLSTVDPRNTARVVESLVLRGDISALSPEEKAAYYTQRCVSLGLDPASKPFAILRLNGKEILYAEKGAADQLAKIHKVNRKVTRGPEVVDIAGRKEVLVVVEASMPDGRVEMDLATVPLSDPDNVFMKTISKAKRRATLAILGLGMLDRDELDTIPASAKGEVQHVHLGESAGRAESSAPAGDETEAESYPASLHPFMTDVGRVELPGEAVLVWCKHRALLATLEPAVREQGWKALCAKTEDVGKMKNAKVWLKRAIAEEDARRQAAAPESDPSLSAQRGGLEPPAAEPIEDPHSAPPATLVQFNESVATLQRASRAVSLWRNQSAGLARQHATLPAWKELMRKLVELLNAEQPGTKWTAETAGDWLKREGAERDARAGAQ